MSVLNIPTQHINCGDYYCCLLDNGLNVQCWGQTGSYLENLVSGQAGFVQLSLNGNFGCGILANLAGIQWYDSFPHTYCHGNRNINIYLF